VDGRNPLHHVHRTTNGDFSLNVTRNANEGRAMIMTKFPGVLTLRPNYRLSKPASRKKGLTVALELEPVKGQSRRTPALWLLLSLCLLLPAPALYAGPAVQA